MNGSDGVTLGNVENDHVMPSQPPAQRQGMLSLALSQSPSVTPPSSWYVL